MTPSTRIPSPSVASGTLAAGWLACCLLLFLNAWPSLETTVDDAWISARYAQHFAEGHGLVYNAGRPPVEGYTNLAWVLVLAAAHRAGLPIHDVLTWGGLLCGALGLLGALALTCRLTGSRAPENLIAPAVLALTPQYAIASTIGLESAQFTAAVLFACWAVLAADAPAHRVGAGLLVGGLAAVRPEGTLVAGVLCAFDLFRRRSRPTDPATWTATAVAGALVLALIGWRYATYGDLVPNTFHAKANIGLVELTPKNLRYFNHDGPLWYVVIAALLASPLLPPRRADRAVLTLVGLAVLLPAMTVLMWMPAGRLVMPVLALSACCATAVALHRDPGGGWARWRQLLLGLLVAGALGALGFLQRPARAYDRIHSVLRDNPASLAARHLARHAPPGAVLATRDAGVVPYFVGTGVEVIELHQRALTLPHPGGANVDAADVTPPNPTFVVLTQQRPDHRGTNYANDRTVLMSLTVPYDYLGRVYQHHHRYYDFYARKDAHIPALPEELVMNRLGPAAPE